MSSWPKRLHMPGHPRHLALVRIVVCLHVLTVFLSGAIPMLVELDIGRYANTYTFFPDFLEGFIEEHVLLLLHVGIVMAILAMFGVGGKALLWTLFVTFLATQHFHYRRSMFHDDWLYFNFPFLVLCLSRCSDAWSLDRWIRSKFKAQEVNAKQTDYRWPIEWMILWFVLIYVSAGLSKLLPIENGIVWMGGGAIQKFSVHFLFDSPIYYFLKRPLFDYNQLTPFSFMAVATILTELSAVLLLFSTKFYAPVLIALLGMHVSIWFFGIPGFVQIFIVCIVFFKSPECFRDGWLRKRH